MRYNQRLTGKEVWTGHYEPEHGTIGLVHPFMLRAEHVSYEPADPGDPALPTSQPPTPAARPALARLGLVQNYLQRSQSSRSLATFAMEELNIDTKYRMQSGFEIPILGFGVYQTPANVTEEVVLHSFKTGYRHVDSARVYRNEGPCAEAIKKSGIPRDELFFTTKVPPRSMGYEEAKASIKSSFSQTGLDYIDLYLIHAPYGGKEARNGTWRALVEAQQDGKIRSLGVSNYGVHHLNELESYIKELEAQNGKGKGGKISVGQWELHPWLTRPDIVEWCTRRGIILEAYCPIVRAQRSNEPILQPLAKKYDKTPEQILLRWSLQKGFVPLPKSVTPSRIEDNAKIFDFHFTPDEMRSLETDDYYVCSWDPTTSND